MSALRYRIYLITAGSVMWSYQLLVAEWLLELRYLSRKKAELDSFFCRCQWQCSARQLLNRAVLSIGSLLFHQWQDIFMTMSHPWQRDAHKRRKAFHWQSLHVMISFLRLYQRIARVEVVSNFVQIFFSNFVRDNMIAISKIIWFNLFLFIGFVCN